MRNLNQDLPILFEMVNFIRIATQSPPVLGSSAPTKPTVTIFGTRHDTGPAQVLRPLQDHFVGTSRKLPQHIAIELDEHRYEKLAKMESLSIPEIHSYTDPELGQLTQRSHLSRFLGYVFSRTVAFFERAVSKNKVGTDVVTVLDIAAKLSRKIYLVDRDVRVTCQRVGESLENRMARMLFRGAETLIPDETPQRHLVEIGFQHFARLEDFDQYKALTQPTAFMSHYLLGSRDAFMASNVLDIVQRNPGEDILLVVGALHTRGILEILLRSGAVNVKVLYSEGL